jgi:VanZ family protein
MLFISFASTNEFSADNTSKVVLPLLEWFLRNPSEEALKLAHFLIRKSAHFCEYAVLGLLASRALSTSSHLFVRRSWFRISLLLIVAYALLDEYHQSFVPSRTASIYDSVIDVVGGLAALTIVMLYRGRKREKMLNEIE